MKAEFISANILRLTATSKLEQSLLSNLNAMLKRAEVKTDFCYIPTWSDVGEAYTLDIYFKDKD